MFSLEAPCGGFILPVLTNSDWGSVRTSVFRRAAVSAFSSWPSSASGASLGLAGYTNRGHGQAVCGSPWGPRRRVPGYVSTLRWFTRGSHWLASGLASLHHVIPPPPGIQDNQPITTSETRHDLGVFLNTDPQTTTPSPENEPGIENDPPPMVCTFRLFPKIIFGHTKGTRTLSSPARD